MNSELLEKRFSEMGARVKVLHPEQRRRRSNEISLRNVVLAGRGGVTLNVRNDGKGEYFTITGVPEARVEVLDVQKDDRHLLLLTENEGRKSKFLCGHDERHWFVAAIPETAPNVTGVRQAKEALQPREVRQPLKSVKKKKRLRRKNDVFVRQGEWFFVREEPPTFDPALVRRNEPLSRGRGKDHVMEEAYRFGGNTVYVNGSGGVISAEEWAQSDRDRRREYHFARTNNPTLYVRGKVSHPDHATINLDGWHRVHMNTEREATSMRSVMFLD